MNREERRRAERAQRQRKPPGTHGGPAKAVSPDRAAAARQDFMAGTVFAAGVAGDPNLDMIMVMVDREPLLRVAPRFADLAELRDEVGSEEIAKRVEGRAAWGVLADPQQSLAKVVLDLDAPVRVRVELLLLADNYRQLWPILTGDHVVGVMFTEDYGDLAGPAELSDLLDSALVLASMPPSKAAGQLMENTATSSATEPPSVMVVENYGDAADDDAEVRPFIVGSPDNPVAGLAWRAATTVQMIGGTGGRQDAVAGYWIDRGLPARAEDGTVGEALGWTVDLSADAIVVRAGDELAVSTDLGVTPEDDPDFPRRWRQAAHDAGFVLVAYGYDDVDPPLETFRSTKAWGLVRMAGDAEAAPPAQERSWWERFRSWLGGRG